MNREDYMIDSDSYNNHQLIDIKYNVVRRVDQQVLRGSDRLYTRKMIIQVLYTCLFGGMLHSYSYNRRSKVKQQWVCKLS